MHRGCTISLRGLEKFRGGCRWIVPDPARQSLSRNTRWAVSRSLLVTIVTMVIWGRSRCCAQHPALITRSHQAHHAATGSLADRLDYVEKWLSPQRQRKVQRLQLAIVWPGLRNLQKLQKSFRSFRSFRFGGLPGFQPPAVRLCHGNARPLGTERKKGLPCLQESDRLFAG